MPKQWFPLESNPSVMTKYIQGIGVDTSVINFHDVLSTEDWALEMVPGPILGVLMLYPIKAATEDHRRAEAARIEADGQVVSPNVYYMKQTVGNACGTVGLLHCAINARNSLSIGSDSYLARFVAATAGMNPDERAAYLERDDEIEETHVAAATEGQSDQVQERDDVDTHFICFTNVDGHLYELDGRKKFPINHGVTSADTLLNDACAVVKQFMARDPTEMRFTIVALGGPSMDD
jgi:ubiquitin carboxyl-terminal hydrolase L3